MWLRFIALYQLSSVFFPDFTSTNEYLYNLDINAHTWIVAMYHVNNKP